MFGPIGMPEMVVIAVIALIIFGPRKLPELGKSLGKSIAEFKRASNELKHTLEEEIRTEELQDTRKSAEVPPTAPTPAAAAPASPEAASASPEAAPASPEAAPASPEGATEPRESTTAPRVDAGV
jgi:TatA/E family protein of Tat protein translocase